MQYISQALHPNPETKPAKDEHGVPVSRTVLVTGATSGIGKAFAELFAKDGYNLVIVARNQEKLKTATDLFKKAGSPSVVAIAKDLSTPSAPKELVADLSSQNIHVDILVNNAGHGRIEKVLEQDYDSIARINHLNVNTPTLLARMLVPRMQEKKYGKVLNVASIVSYVSGPVQAVYNASKAYLLSFSNALGEELKDSGITVTAVCPGITRTEFFERAGADSEKVLNTPGATMSAQEVAAMGYAALFRGDATYICGFKNYAAAKLANITPGVIAAPLMQKLNEGMK